MTEKTHRMWRRVAQVVCGVGFVVFAVTGVRLAADMYYSDRALPGTTVAGTDVSGMDRSQILDSINARVDGLTFTFEHTDNVVTANATDAGLAVDTDKVADDALSSKRGANFISQFSPADEVDVAPTSTADLAALQTFLNDSFPTLVTEPVDATVVLNAEGAFEVTPGSAGTRISAEAALPQVEQAGQDLNSAQIPVDILDVAPAVSDEQATALANGLNTMLDSGLSLTLDDEQVADVDRATLASWISVGDNLAVEVDHDAIQAFVDSTVVPAVHVDPVEEVKAVDKNGAFLRDVQTGKNGQDITDAAALSQQIAAAIQKGEPVVFPLSVSEVAFSSRTIVEPVKTIVIDLASQTTTLYEDDIQIASWLVSTGKPGYTTPKGTFYVRAHVREQTMRGFNNDGTTYETPNVEWVTYFNGSIAFHAVYWHHNFGHVMSHGCINMTYDAAKYVYNWATIGTKVIVR